MGQGTIGLRTRDRGMFPDDPLDPPPPARPTAPRFTFRPGKLCRRLGLVLFLIAELAVWGEIHKWMRLLPKGQRGQIAGAFLYLSLKAALYILIATVVLWALARLVFRYVARPLMLRWYNPRSRDIHASHPLPFIMKVHERIVAEVGARHILGGRSIPGTLFQTTEALYFFPFAWDSESWTLPLGQVADVTTCTPRRRVPKSVQGFPDCVIIHDQQGMENWFVTGDPAVVLAWFGKTPTPTPEAMAFSI